MTAGAQLQTEATATVAAAVPDPSGALLNVIRLGMIALVVFMAVPALLVARVVLTAREPMNWAWVTVLLGSDAIVAVAVIVALVILARLKASAL